MKDHEIDLMFKDMQNRADSILSFCKTSAHNPSLNRMQVIVNQIDDDQPGGEVYVDNECIVISINSGTVGTIIDIAEELVSKKNSDFWKTFLNIKTDELIGAEGIIHEWGHFFYDSKQHAKVISSLMAIYIGRFIIAHEMGHALNGHCDYGTDKSGKLFKFGMFLTDSGEIVFENKDLRAMEIDADSFAITNTVIELIALNENYDQMVACHEYISRSDVAYWCGAAMTIMFHYLDLIGRYDSCHPSVKARFYNMVSVVNDCLEQYYNLPQEEKKKIFISFSEGLNLAERFFSETNNMDSWLCNFDKIALNEVDEANKLWTDKIRIVLQQYAYVPLAL